MTKAQIVTKVASRLNLSSAAALARIGEEVNDRYRRVTSSLGLVVARRVTDTAETTEGEREVTFDDLEKILVVSCETPNYRVVYEITWEQMLDRKPREGQGTPHEYAISTMGPDGVTILLDYIPSATAVTLTAKGYAFPTDLADSDAPQFPPSFHDILVAGALADELYKLEKPQLALIEDKRYDDRCGDLRLFIAKSPNLAQYPGQRANGRMWMR